MQMAARAWLCPSRGDRTLEGLRLELLDVRGSPAQGLVCDGGRTNMAVATASRLVAIAATADSPSAEKIHFDKTFDEPASE